MILLVDTSVWIEHFREGNLRLANYLSEGLVLMHPCVAGELACGSLKNRTEFLSYLNALPSATPATNQETLVLLNDRKLWGRGLSWIDVHLLASALISHCRLWTLDKELDRAAKELGLS